jgi:hypothetical protein
MIFLSKRIVFTFSGLLFFYCLHQLALSVIHLLQRLWVGAFYIEMYLNVVITDNIRGMQSDGRS